MSDWKMLKKEVVYDLLFFMASKTLLNQTRLTKILINAEQFYIFTVLRMKNAKPWTQLSRSLDYLIIPMIVSFERHKVPV